MNLALWLLAATALGAVLDLVLFLHEHRNDPNR
jgi:hypothetical protein